MGTDYNSQTCTPRGRNVRTQSLDDQLARSSSSGIIKTENSTLNRKHKKLAFYEPVEPYQSAKVQRSQSGIISRCQAGPGIRSQFGSVERSQSGIITRSQSGLLKLSQTRSPVRHSQFRPVERSQSMATNRSESGTRVLRQSRPVERSQSMAVRPSQPRKNNPSHSVDPEIRDFPENKRSLASFKSTEFGSQLFSVRKTDHQALLNDQVGNVSSQWQQLCKSASMEVILNIASVDAFTINVIFNCNIIGSLNPVEISSVIFNTRNILFANWFMAGPNLSQSIVRRSPHFNVILYQIQTFLIIVSSNCVSKFVNLFKDLQNRCVSGGFYKPWICLEETKSL